MLGFPAPAGIDPEYIMRKQRPERFPRARGDRPFDHCESDLCYWVSPRPRGSTLGEVEPLGADAGFPAPAGIDRLQ